MINAEAQCPVSFDPSSGRVDGVDAVERRLSDLKGYFADERAFEARLLVSDPVVYSVSSVEPATGEGQLHYGIGRIEPGRIGDEFYMTKGHFHAWRPAAEVYVGLSGEGAMLLEDESSGETSLLPMRPHSAIYVPGSTAHRTINTGDVPLIYMGIYPAEAGHEYGVIAERNFGHVVIAEGGVPRLMPRAEYLSILHPAERS